MTSEPPTTSETNGRTRSARSWLGIAIAVAFGLFYAWDLWEAVSNIVALPSLYDAIGIGSERVPWWLLVIGILIPPAVYVVAFALGRRRGIPGRALLLLVGLAVTAALSLSVIAFEAALRPDVLALLN